MFVTFSFIATLASRHKTRCCSACKNMEFNLLISDSPIYVPCKFEMLILRMALIIKYLCTVDVSFCTHCILYADMFNEVHATIGVFFCLWTNILTYNAKSKICMSLFMDIYKLAYNATFKNSLNSVYSHTY